MLGEIVKDDDPHKQNQKQEPNLRDSLLNTHAEIAPS